MVRPKLDYHDALFVNMSVTLMQILELNERRQYLASSVMYTFVSNFIILQEMQEMNDVILNHCRRENFYSNEAKLSVGSMNI